MIRIRKTGAPLSEEKLVNVEGRFGITFPPDYRSFLLQYNGGTPEFNTVRAQGMEDAQLTFESFLGIDTGRKGDDLVEAFQTYKDSEAPRIPGRLVPIGDDSLGNLYCISTTGSDAGVIYLWNHEEEQMDSGAEVSNESLFLVADSFSTFLRQFGDAPDKRREERRPDWVEVIQAGDIEGFRAWLDAGGDPLAVDEERLDSPLALAVAEERGEMLVLLLDRGIDPGAVVERAVASSAWNLVIAALARLKEEGRTVNSFWFQEALEECADARVIEAFIDAGADVNRRLQRGNSLFHATEGLCGSTVIRLLLDRGAKVGEFGYLGDSALAKAIRHGNLEVCKMLIDAGEQLYAQPPIPISDRIAKAVWRSKGGREYFERNRPKPAAWYLDNHEKGKQIRDEVIAYAAAKGQEPPR